MKTDNEGDDSLYSPSAYLMSNGKNNLCVTFTPSLYGTSKRKQTKKKQKKKLVHWPHFMKVMITHFSCHIFVREIIKKFSYFFMNATCCKRNKSQLLTVSVL